MQRQAIIATMGRASGGGTTGGGTGGGGTSNGSGPTLSTAVAAKLIRRYNAASLGLAGGTLVSSVPDMTGNGSAATSTGTGRPSITTINSRPAFLFDGVGTYLDTDIFNAAQVVVVGQSTDVSPFPDYKGLFTFKQFVGFSDASIGALSGSNDLVVQDLDVGYNTAYNTAISQILIDGHMKSNFAPLNALKVVSYKYTPFNSPNGYTIGWSTHNTGRQWKGGISEVLCFSTALTDAEEASLYGSLNTYYNLNRIPNLYLNEGNSIDAGTALNSPALQTQNPGYLVWQQLMSADTRGTRLWELQTRAVGGSTSSAIAGRVTDGIATMKPVFGKIIVHLNEGTNDMLFNGMTGANAFNGIMSVVNSYLNADPRVCVLLSTCINSHINAGGTYNTQFLTERVNYNNLIKGLTQTARLKIADITTVPEMEADNCWSNTTYFLSDGVHPTYAGEQKIAAVRATVAQTF